MASNNATRMWRSAVTRRSQTSLCRTGRASPPQCVPLKQELRRAYCRQLVRPFGEKGGQVT